MFFFLFPVWAETGEFRESNHNTMAAVTNMDHSQMNFQTPTSRNRRDRKNDGKSAKHFQWIYFDQQVTYLLTYPTEVAHIERKKQNLQPKRGT